MKINKSKDVRLLRSWHNQIHERDTCCRRCSSMSYLECHHIIGRSCKELRYSLENGLLLCRECHRFVELYKSKAVEFYKSIGIDYDKLHDIKWSVK